MRVVAYSIKSFEKEPLALANNKKHEITLISNALGPETAAYAQGKEAVIVYNADDNLSAPVVNRLADLGVKYIATRSTDISHIDRDTAAFRKLKIANVSVDALRGVAENDLPTVLAAETILNLDNWQHHRCKDGCACTKSSDADLDFPKH
ncbi:D-lactate dehydrogenase [Pedobacter sp. BAL39]|uniref:lactate dehydrogenase n=1 Tax=Pedobacter sp. BAL39 TaxID=391596 RepID=UPI000155A00C|nr:lactate dehydrogenase [Pedobacter sp. BAL39]EDM36797.1 D-lactate dehydrogenase [Pedobacter sp. BAL39]